ncbi:MAG: hypothetical protein NW226_10520 [Microscillaceae bacterium]|nr:hypothetical protein [Microscillaceae bacterium]
MMKKSYFMLKNLFASYFLEDGYKEQHHSLQVEPPSSCHPVKELV